MQEKPVILASASPRRQELLKKIIKKFKVVPSTIDETKIKTRTTEGFAVKAALAKAEDVAKKHKKAVVIGADTIVVLGKKILGKPKNKQDAYKMLKTLSGTTHRVITGVVVIDCETFHKLADYEITKVTMKKIPDKAIREYIETGRPLDKAGAYGIQEIEDPFISRINGDYNNVVGMPLKLLDKLLKSLKFPK